MASPTIIRPTAFTFYQTLPLSHRRIEFSLKNKKLGDSGKEVYNAIQDFVNRLIYLRRNFKDLAFRKLEVRMYPLEDFELAQTKALYSLALDADDCKSSDTVYACIFAPYALDGETRLTLRVYASEVVPAEAKELYRQDKEREDEQEAIRGGEY